MFPTRRFLSRRERHRIRISTEHIGTADSERIPTDQTWGCTLVWFCYDVAMNGYTHMVVGGLAAGLPVALSVAERKLGFSIGAHTIYPIVGVFPGVMGALGPDVDMPNSQSGKRLRNFLKISVTVSGVVVLLLSFYVGIGARGGRVLHVLIPSVIFFAAASCLRMFIVMAKHRRETHSGLVVMVLLLPSIYIVRFSDPSLFTNTLLSAWTGFCVGWLSHLVADSFNYKGVPWLYPLNGKHFRIGGIKTGSEGEKTFRIFCIVLFVTVYVVLIISRNA